MHYLITEDPGIRCAGLAIFDIEDRLLVRATCIKSPCLKGKRASAARDMALAMRDFVRDSGLQNDQLIARLGIEWPLILPDAHQVKKKQKVDKNDLIALAGVSSAFVTCFPKAHVTDFYPREWKDTIEPDVMTRKIYERLSPQELACVVWNQKLKAGEVYDPVRGTMHNCFDAIGIGLKILGRLERHRVYAGI